MRKDAPLSVDVPSAEQDNPGWVKVGVIAAIGFAIGIAWPKVTGFRLGPSPPGESAASLASKAATEPAPEAPAPNASVAPQAVSSAVAPSVAPAASALPAPAASPTVNAPASPTLLQVNVQKVSVLSCKTDNGEVMKGKECGAITALDELVRPKLRELDGCSTAGSQSGKLSFLATADFANGRLLWNLGKSTKLENVDGVMACLKTIFQSTSLHGVAHEHARYTVAYSVNLAPTSDAKPSAGSPGESSANADRVHAGEAVVAWEVALVRDAPKTGAVVARLPRGTKVEVGAAQDGWYAVKFGDGFASDGWVHRGAIGK
jgi:hypothetical protein